MDCSFSSGNSTPIDMNDIEQKCLGLIEVQNEKMVETAKASAAAEMTAAEEIGKKAQEMISNAEQMKKNANERVANAKTAAGTRLKSVETFLKQLKLNNRCMTRSLLKDHLERSTLSEEEKELVKKAFVFVKKRDDSNLHKNIFEKKISNSINDKKFRSS